MHALKDKRVAFCGRLVTEKRRMVIARLEMAGGRYDERVSPKTNILVIPLGYQFEMKPQQLTKAEQLQSQGTLRIMDEPEFLSMLG